MASILIVDDYPASRYALGRMLRRAGHQTREVDSAREMLQALEDHAFELVVLDIHLPDADGLDLCRRLKSDPRHAHLAVVIVTASYASSDARQRVEASGADAYLEQPVLEDQLDALVSRLLGRG
ncbi:MAG TPA: response regulator [Thermoanaerobaculia bacterium]|nr:response regulator [Thermoanaerobaculia bacterium]